MNVKMKNLTWLLDTELLKPYPPATDAALQRRQLKAYEAMKRRRLAERQRWVQKLKRLAVTVVERANLEYRVRMCDSYLDDYRGKIEALKADMGVKM